MNILLTNDDGVHAKGINTLFKILSEKHSVFIIAPSNEKSGSSNAMTFKKNFKIINIAKNIYAIDAFPADCVNMALRGNIIPKADLVISGINHGPNLGEDIYFSGTVGGARVACIYGVPAIAISMNRMGESKFFTDASKFLLKYIEKNYLYFNNKCLFLNINYPDLPKNKIQGVKHLSLGKRRYNDSYKMLSNNDKEIDIQFNFGNIMGPFKDEISDISELEKGYITITPLTLDCTNYEFLRSITAENAS
jgi:5'-nucleotidase